MCAFYRDDSQQLCVDGLSLADITTTYGSPLYVYSGSGITEAFTQFQAAVAPVSGKVHFAMKANSALGVLALIGRLGGGMDIVSSGELARARANSPEDTISIPPPSRPISARTPSAEFAFMAKCTLPDTGATAA